MVSRIKLYHGAHYKELDSILIEGLKANRPQPNEEWGVYLTPDFEKAARYGVNIARREIPIIVAVELSKNEMHRLIYDPYDRESIWYEDQFDENGWEENVEWIEDGAKAVALKFAGITDEPLSWKYGSIFSLSYDYNSDEESLAGLNILDWAADKIIKNVRNLTEDEVKKALRVEYGSSLDSSEGWFDIDIDGNLTLSEDWYSSREQLIFPDNVPFKSITEIWIRPSDHPSVAEELPLFAHVKTSSFPYKEIVEASISDLPQESRSRLQRIDHLIQEIMWLPGSREVPDQDTIDEWIEAFIDYDKSWDEPIELLKKLREMSPTNEPGEDWAPTPAYTYFLQKLNTEFSNFGGIAFEDWGQTRQSEPVTWWRIHRK